MHLKVYVKLETESNISTLLRDLKALGCSIPNESEGATKGLRVS